MSTMSTPLASRRSTRLDQIRRWSLVMAVSAASAQTAAAQCRDTTDTGTRGPTMGYAPIGGVTDDRFRVLQVLGRCSTAGQLIRSSSALNRRVAVGTQPAWTVFTPSLGIISNSALPFSMNDGALWAGRGINAVVTAGATVEWNALSVAFVPQFAYEQNRDFFVFRSATPDRSDFASPWHAGATSVDMPSRFGDQPNRIFWPGESHVELKLPHVAIGATTESLWWGPGIRNALVLSNNAAGIPQVYARTRAPLATPIGDVEARWFVGDLTESPYFDRVASNDHRSISAIAATLTPANAPNVTVGIARAVYAPTGSAGDAAAHFADVFLRWNQRYDTTITPASHPNDQVLSAFARWVLPGSGLELYGEWAKLVPPRSIREMFVEPQRGQGYTLGLQLVRPFAAGHFRLQTEATMLEQTPPARYTLVRSYYTSGQVPQGYTQRGQIIGAAIGPGSSSQWLAADYLERRRRIGLVIGRIRWDDDAFFRQPTSIGFYTHDVSVFEGVRGSGTVRETEISFELLHTLRYNYLYQSATSGYLPDPTFDVRNFTLKLSVGAR